jgi:hypothetical protein
VRDIESRPSLRRGDRFPEWRGRRGLAGRLAALAVVSAVLLLPHAAPALGLAGPSITPNIRGTGGTNGWYKSSVTVNWVFDPLPDSSSGCDAVTISADTRGRHLDCSANWGAVHIDYPLTVKVDRTAPSVAGKANRYPDANGWFNHAVPIAFYGGDPMSGIASCSSTTYKGPDNAQAVVHGTCTDNAGNVAGAAVTFAYDSTPPKLKKLTLTRLSRAVLFRWQVSPDTKRVVITRSPGAKRGTSANVYGGTAKSFKDKGLKIGKRYRYTVSAYDVAGNKASRRIAVTAAGALIAPAPGARVKGAPSLQWAAVAGASYYNVQLVRGGTIFSAWPKGTSLRLPRSWVYHGHRYRLHRGVYRWFVWPGFGTLSANRYGRLIGKSSFFFAG